MKNKKQLTRKQRYETEVLLRAGKRQKETAEPVEKDQSVISRERFRRKRSFTDSIRKKKVVKELTEEQWLPEQIVGRARREGIPIGKPRAYLSVYQGR
jgi:IS30 family transposase